MGADPPELTKVRASYQKQIREATAPINARYVEYLENLKKQLGGKGDLDGAGAVQQELDAIVRLQESTTSPASDKIVIWNQNNNGKGDRGTKKVNVSLLLGDREVWSKKSVRVEWDETQPGKTEIEVPTMVADKLRVEITDSVNEKGGLSEVEYYRGGRNVALGGEVAVSATWENDRKHVGTMLTDGVQTTYWLVPDKQEGWAVITLKP